jgi:hypothetical protein
LALASGSPTEVQADWQSNERGATKDVNKIILNTKAPTMDGEGPTTHMMMSVTFTHLKQVSYRKNHGLSDKALCMLVPEAVL